MQRLIIKSIHEHGFGFAFTHKEHDEVFLPKKLLTEAGITYLKPADELIGEVIPNFKDKLDGGCKYICTEIGYAHKFEKDFSKDIQLWKECQSAIRFIRKSDEEELREYLPKILYDFAPDLFNELFSRVYIGDFRQRQCVRVRNLLELEFVSKGKTVICNYDLAIKSPAFYLRVPNFGRSSLGIIENYLAKFNLNLSTPIEEIRRNSITAIGDYLDEQLAHLWEGE
jgi:hypothetical protein